MTPPPKSMQRKLRMKYSGRGHWNRVAVYKVFLEQPNPIEPKVSVMIPMYQPLQISKCEKCGKIIAEPKELIKIQKRWSHG